VSEALRYDDIEKKGHHYPGSQGRPAGGVSPLAGHGVGIDDATHEPNDAILRYFHQVDTGLRAFLRDEHAPLVLAGVEYLLPIYRRANTYPYMLEGGVETLTGCDQKNCKNRHGLLCSRIFSRPKKAPRHNTVTC
jgi:hypothetical protein